MGLDIKQWSQIVCAKEKLFTTLKLKSTDIDNNQWSQIVEAQHIALKEILQSSQTYEQYIDSIKDVIDELCNKILHPTQC